MKAVFKDSFLLLSEKSLLVAKYYNLDKDPFVGIMEGGLKWGVKPEILAQVYQQLTFKRTSLQLLFEKNNTEFKKQFKASAFKELKVFKNKTLYQQWKTKPLDFNTGPLHEMAIYQGLFKKELCFKFHHLILDGLSLFVFFKELSQAYFKALEGDFKPPADDFKVYQKLMAHFYSQERDKPEEKQQFWLQHFKHYCQHKTNVLNSDTLSNNNINQADKTKQSLRFLKKSVSRVKNSPGRFCLALKNRDLKQLYAFQAQEDLALFYVLLALYCKVLKKCFQIPSLCLRVPFSARYYLKDKEQKNLLASLSRGLPFFVHQNQVKTIAKDLQTQARKMRPYLINARSFLPRREEISFSKLKHRSLSLSFSYLPYIEKAFIGQIKNFYWQRSFLDLLLFIILSEKQTLLCFSYRPEIFSTQEIKNLSKEFKKSALAAF